MPKHTASSLPTTNNYIEQLPCILTVTENTNWAEQRTFL